MEIPKEKVLNIEFINKSLKACCDYFPNNEKLKKFYERANNDLNLDKIKVLKISDYNTTGLYDIDGRVDSAWYGLVKSTGNSTKSGVKGGSYGSGKHAPFVFSNFRTIFYGTYVDNEGFAFQGKSILCAHEMDGELKTNVGFYGNVTDKCYPIRNVEEVDEIYRRYESGTDVFIIGCNMKNTSLDDNQISWRENISLSIVENFWKIILDGKLEVRIIDESEDEDVISISRENVREYAQLLEESKMKIDDEEEFTANKFIRVNDENVDYSYGRIIENNDVRIKIMRLSDSLEKKVLYFRNTEMKIKVREIRKKQIGFYAIFEALGDKISEILRDSEPQTHDEWNANNIEDELEKNIAKKCIRKIEAWINSEIEKLLVVEDVEEVEVEGMDAFIIDDENDVNETEKDESIFDNRKNRNLKEELIEDKNSKSKRNKINDSSMESNLTDGGTEPNGEEYGGEGNQQTDENHDPKDGSNNGGENGKLNYTDHASSGNQYHIIEVPFLGTPYDSKTNIQKIIIKPFENQIIQNAKVDLFKIVDSGDKEKLYVKNAFVGNTRLEVDKNTIKNITIDGNTVIDIKLEENRKYILEVKIYVQD